MGQRVPNLKTIKVAGKSTKVFAVARRVWSHPGNMGFYTFR